MFALSLCLPVLRDQRNTCQEDEETINLAAKSKWIVEANENEKQLKESEREKGV